MESKKLMAKLDALKNMSKSLREDSKKPFADGLKSKMQKVTVMAPDTKSLEKGLSKAQQLIKAKFGEAGMSDDAMEESDEMADSECPMCDGEGCDACEDEEEMA